MRLRPPLVVLLSCEVGAEMVNEARIWLIRMSRSILQMRRFCAGARDAAKAPIHDTELLLFLRIPSQQQNACLQSQQSIIEELRSRQRKTVAYETS